MQIHFSFMFNFVESFQGVTTEVGGSELFMVLLPTFLKFFKNLKLVPDLRFLK